MNVLLTLCKHCLLQINKSEKPESCDNVKVVVRCRPLNEREKSMCYRQAVSVDEMRGTITVHKTDSSNEPPKTFTFDTVFGPESKQLDVYNLTARPIIDSVLEGYNGEWCAARFIVVKLTPSKMSGLPVAATAWRVTVNIYSCAAHHVMSF